jgi:hypothetical protein
MSLSWLRERRTRRTLVITGYGAEELDSSAAELPRLLGAIVAQAMDDGMTGIRIGVAPDTGEAWMEYFGPVFGKKDESWGMVPPPEFCYPALVQICVSRAELQAGLPLTGVIPAVRGREPISLNFEMRQVDNFQVSWDGRFVRARGDSAAVGESM